MGNLFDSDDDEEDKSGGKSKAKSPPKSAVKPKVKSPPKAPPKSAPKQKVKSPPKPPPKQESKPKAKPPPAKKSKAYADFLNVLQDDDYYDDFQFIQQPIGIGDGYNYDNNDNYFINKEQPIIGTWIVGILIIIILGFCLCAIISLFCFVIGLIFGTKVAHKRDVNIPHDFHPI